MIVFCQAVFKKSLAFSISSTGNQSLMSLKNKNISDLFRVDCLFGKGNSTDALIFITKMAFEQITDSSQDSEDESDEESDEESDDESDDESDEESEQQSDEESDDEKKMKPFREIKLRDRVTYLWNPPDETYDATVVKLTTSARRVTLKFDDGDQKTFQGGWFNEENYGTQWWYAN